MRRWLACLLLILLSALAARAEERPNDPVRIMTGAIAYAKLCTYTAKKVALDKNGEEKGEWAVSKDESNVLQKLIEGDKNYHRPFEHMNGSVMPDPDREGARNIQGSLIKALWYTYRLIPYAKIQELRITLGQELREEEWVPANLEVIVKYWALDRGRVHEKHRAKLNCSPAEMASK